jgi:hypothetical protein
VAVTVAHDYTEERAALVRLRWYMLLRWSGVVVLYSSGLLAREIGHYHYSLTASNVLAPFVVVYNVAVWRLVTSWTRRPPADWHRAYRVLGNVQAAWRRGPPWSPSPSSSSLAWCSRDETA